MTGGGGGFNSDISYRIDSFLLLIVFHFKLYFDQTIDFEYAGIWPKSGHLKLLLVQEFWETSWLNKCCGDVPVTCKYHFETESLLSVFEDIPFEHFSASYCIGADVVVGPVLACFLPSFLHKTECDCLAFSRNIFCSEVCWGQTEIDWRDEFICCVLYGTCLRSRKQLRFLILGLQWEQWEVPLRPQLFPSAQNCGDY